MAWFLSPFVVNGVQRCCTPAPWRTRGSKRKPFSRGNPNAFFLRDYQRKKNCRFGRKGLEVREGSVLIGGAVAPEWEEKSAFVLTGPLRVFWRRWRLIFTGAGRGDRAAKERSESRRPECLDRVAQQ